MKKQENTNALRELTRRSISFTTHTYEHGKEAVDGATVAKLTGIDPARLFKTLVAVGAGGQHYVFDIPALAELDMKKAARAVGEKSISLIHVKELLPLTGYVRGGCSPIGMKKKFPTVIDESAKNNASIVVSAGKIGLQVELSVEDLIEAVNAALADLTLGK